MVHNLINKLIARYGKSEKIEMRIEFHLSTPCVCVFVYGALNTIQWDTYTIEWDILICKRTFRFKNKKTPLDYKL